MRKLKKVKSKIFFSCLFISMIFALNVGLVSAYTAPTTTTLTMDKNTAYFLEMVTFIAHVEKVGGSSWPIEGVIWFHDMTTEQNLSDSPVPLDVYSEATLEWTVPLGYPLGYHDINATFIPENPQDYQSSSDGEILDVLGTGFTANLAANPEKAYREETSVNLTTVLTGANVSNKLAKYYYEDSIGLNYIGQSDVIDNVSVYLWTPEWVMELGGATVWVKIYTDLGEYTGINDSTLVEIWDKTEVSVSYHQEPYYPQVVVVADVRVFLASNIGVDVENATVEVYDLLDDQLVGIYETDENGVFTFTYNPQQVGQHTLNLTVYPEDPFIEGGNHYSTYIVHGETLIVTEVPGEAQRDTMIYLNVTVYYYGEIVTEGTLLLKYTNGTIIETFSVMAKVVYAYYVFPSHELGEMVFFWEYEGTMIYDPSNSTTDVVTFWSIPNFAQGSISANPTSTITGQNVEMKGQVIDEVGEGVENALITFYEGGSLRGTAVTGFDGWFYYNYSITSSTPIGWHTILVKFEGDGSIYCYPAQSSPMVQFFVRTPITLTMETTLYAEEDVGIQVEGTPNHMINLYWQPAGTGDPANWIGNIPLDQNGQGSTTWNVPYHKGLIVVFANNSYSDIDSKTCEVWIKPTGSFMNLPASVTVGEVVGFSVQCSERYRVLANHLPVTGWFAGGTQKQISLSFTSRGEHVVAIEANDTYVVHTFIEEIVEAWDIVQVTLNCPSSTDVGSQVTATVYVVGVNTGPVAGATVHLYANSSMVSSSITDSYGEATFTFSLSEQGTYSMHVVSLASDYCHQGDSNIETLTVGGGSPDPNNDPPNIDQVWYTDYPNSLVVINESEEMEFEISVSDDGAVSAVYLLIGATRVDLTQFSDTLWKVSYQFSEKGDYLITLLAEDDKNAKTSTFLCSVKVLQPDDSDPPSEEPDNGSDNKGETNTVNLATLSMIGLVVVGVYLLTNRKHQ